MRRAVVLLPLLAACPGDDGPQSGDASTTGSRPDPPDATHGGDDTGGLELLCLDVLAGNQDPASAAPVELGTTAVDVSLADLAVCRSSPSDFFELRAECAGYLSVELRRRDRAEHYMPDLVLYDGDQAVEEVFGAWKGFFLKPLQRHVDAGRHHLEVRHSGGGRQRYDLAVVLLPDVACR